MGRKVKSKGPDKSMEQEVTGVVICFFSLFLLIGVYARGSMGSFGNLVINFFFGMMGLVTYIFPIFLMIYGIQCITKANKKRKRFFRLSTISLAIFLAKGSSPNLYRMLANSSSEYSFTTL